MKKLLAILMLTTSTTAFAECNADFLNSVASTLAADPSSAQTVVSGAVSACPALKSRIINIALTTPGVNPGDVVGATASGGRVYTTKLASRHTPSTATPQTGNGRSISASPN